MFFIHGQDELKEYLKIKMATLVNVVFPLNVYKWNDISEQGHSEIGADSQKNLFLSRSATFKSTAALPEVPGQSKDGNWDGQYQMHKIVFFFF